MNNYKIRVSKYKIHHCKPNWKWKERKKKTTSSSLIYLLPPFSLRVFGVLGSVVFCGGGLPRNIWRSPWRFCGYRNWHNDMLSTTTLLDLAPVAALLSPYLLIPRLLSRLLPRLLPRLPHLPCLWILGRCTSGDLPGTRSHYDNPYFGTRTCSRPGFDWCP